MRTTTLLLIILASASGNVYAQALGPQLAGQPSLPRVAADLEHRPASAQPITAANAAAEVSPIAAIEEGTATGTGPAGTQTVPSVTHRGRPLPGAVRIARNRVYDPHSGLYYWTSGAGPGEVVLP